MPTPARSVPKVSPMKGTAVDDYVAAKLTAEQAAIVNALRQLVRAVAPKSTESIKWAQPVFQENAPFAFIKPAKSHVTFGFWRGAQLDDPQGLLQGEGDRMKHIRLTSAADIRKKDFQAWVKQAVRLNHEKGDPTKRENR